VTELTTYEETLLLHAIAAGDESSFSRLYDHYHPRVRTYVCRLVKMPELADDLVQDIFIKLWETRKTLPEVKCFSAFLFTIARNHCLNSLQAISKSNQALSGLIRHFQNYRLDDETLDKDYLRFIEKALAAISPRSREVFRLCREQTMTYEQAASELGISRNAVKKHMVAVMRSLKDAAGKELGLSMDLLVILLSLLSLLTGNK
jgi:RNA polymerase sigma-70 factor (ECF subfamily)